MLRCAVMYFVVLCCVVLYSFVLCCVLHSVLSCVVIYFDVFCFVVLCFVVMLCGELSGTFFVLCYTFVVLRYVALSCDMPQCFL